MEIVVQYSGIQNSWVEQERVEQYILQGGTDSTTDDNMCCDSCETTWPTE